MSDVTVTLTEEARDLTRRTLLADTVNLLDDLSSQLAGLRDDLHPTAIDVDDARSMVRTLRANLDALDALGWPEATDAGAAA